MSGYLDVKLPPKAAKGFSSWKAWKKQWCTLRPCPVKKGIIIVFHASAGMSSNSQVEIPGSSILCRIDSKTKSHAFGIYASSDSQKSLLLLAGQSESDTQLWMLRIRMMLYGKNHSEKYVDKENHFNISLIDNEFSKRCGLKGLFGILTTNSNGFEVLDNFTDAVKASFDYCDIQKIELAYKETKSIDNQRICVISTNSTFKFGSGQIFIFCHAGKVLSTLLRNRFSNPSEIRLRRLTRRLSRSEGMLLNMLGTKREGLIDNQRDSGLSSCEQISPDKRTKWYCSIYNDSSIRISRDDAGLVLKGKHASTLLSMGLLLNSSGNIPNSTYESCESVIKLSDKSPLSNCISLDRSRSESSIMSEIYEEIPDDMYDASSSIYSTSEKSKVKSIQNTPPPLPPKYSTINGRLDSASDSGVEEESIYSTSTNDSMYSRSSSIRTYMEALNSLPQTCTSESNLKSTKYSESNKLPIKNNHRLLDVFRKRIKSESQVSRNKYFDKSKTYQHSHESPTANKCKSLSDYNSAKSTNTKKPMRKFGKQDSSDKMTSTTGSYEALDRDDKQNFSQKHLSQSHENLNYRLNGIRNSSKTKRQAIDFSLDWNVNNSDENVEDLSLLIAENSFKHDYPEEIIELVLRGKTDLVEKKLKERAAEDEYVVMSPNGSLGNGAKQELPRIAENSPIITEESDYVIMRGA